MYSHLFPFHSSIWDIVENGMHMLDSYDENCNAIDAQEMIHKNAQKLLMSCWLLYAGKSITRFY
jgi:hypothetical protein